MNRKKRFLIPLLLTAGLIFTFCACSSGKNPTGANNSYDSSAQTSVSDSQSTSGNSSDLDGGNSDQSQTAPEKEKFKLVVPEGYTAARIGISLEELDFCTTEEFLAACQSFDYSSYSIMQQQPDDENIGYKLEGYLFPATYEFNKNDSIDDVIAYMLSTTQKRFDSNNLWEQIAQSDYSIHEILSLASIIQKEALDEESMTYISSVLHNRLAIGQKLECDVTIKYCTGVFEHFLPDRFDELKYHYNTYRCAALPAGPICNPGIQAISAALSPADTNYYYFVTDEDNNYFYAETYDEHKQNCLDAGIDLG